MNYKNHFKVFLYTTIPIAIGIVVANFLIIDFLFKWYYIPALFIAFFLINPDIDLLWGPDDHRSFITHSVLYPLIVYWGLHSFWDLMNAKLLGIIIFYPVLIHLCADYMANSTLDKKKTSGSWQITWNFLPMRKKRLGKKGSIIWVTFNILFILFYIVWILYLENFILNTFF